MNELPRLNVQSTGQNSHSVNTFRGSHYAMFRFNSRVPHVCSSSESVVIQHAFPSLLSTAAHTGTWALSQWGHPATSRLGTFRPNPRRTTVPLVMGTRALPSEPLLLPKLQS